MKCLEFPFELRGEGIAKIFSFSPRLRQMGKGDRGYLATGGEATLTSSGILNSSSFYGSKVSDRMTITFDLLSIELEWDPTKSTE